jgi:hypothetical protein
MNILKIVAVGGLAIGAATAFAPLASADDFASIIDSEISGENSLFQFEALLAGDSADVMKAAAPGDFDTVPLSDAPQATDPSGLTVLDYELYGVSPIWAGIPADPGSYEVFNGAVTKFDDAYNVLLYAAENKDALVPAGDLFGNHITDALTGGTDAGAFEYFWNFAIGDLGGFFNMDLSSLDISSQMATELFSLFDPGSLLGSLF